ncbi:MAG: enoyl-CoA hydratase, partial [Chloroflexi bacterium]|nr:enoyl-CoA hydratase [Chloroflexota bacterium]
MAAIRTETSDAVLTITLDRPDALNAFDRAMKDELL